jgi:radical SAM protein with 4Fe4S-binding SPASM domain
MCLRLCMRRVRLRLRWGRSMSWLTRREPAAPVSDPRRLEVFRRSTAEGHTTVHLRPSSDGGAELFVNADQVFRLNSTAATMARLILAETPEDEAMRQLARRYRVDRRRLATDLTALRADLEALVAPQPACPIHDLNLDIISPFSAMPDAPYRMDLALTYRCNDNCPHCYNARPRSYPEMSTSEWRTILDRLWEIGIPHICFTGGEATLRDDLAELVAHSRALGQVVGLLTNGRRLSDAGYVRALAQAGLDHVQITLESGREEVHDRMVAARGAWKQTVAGIRNAVDAHLFVMTNTTLLSDNAPHIGETIDFLAELGVRTVGCNALIHAGRGAQVSTGLEEGALAPLLKVVRARTEAHGQRLIWYTPTQYCHFDPVEAELGIKGCTAARYNMCIEPDGAVLPCQSFYTSLGNILHDSWDSIWNHELSLWLRERRYMSDECLSCALVAECGGGCPLSPGSSTSSASAWIPAGELLPVGRGWAS